MRLEIKDVFKEHLSPEDVRTLIRDVVEDSTKSSANQVWKGHSKILKTLAKLERVYTKNYNVPPRAKKQKGPVL